ncbi:hypothetical protein J6590_009871 [Homalodisca vitripennis]|nr:hypothetical protein J6590_009871 [Homalodisca vitripennis]
MKILLVIALVRGKAMKSWAILSEIDCDLSSVLEVESVEAEVSRAAAWRIDLPASRLVGEPAEGRVEGMIAALFLSPPPSRYFPSLLLIDHNFFPINSLIIIGRLEALPSSSASNRDRRPLAAVDLRQKQQRTLSTTELKEGT